MEGLILIDKPKGISSHAVINTLRRVLLIKRIGHAGTLDPFASGLLLCGISRGATKHLGVFVGLDKIYEATFVLGGTTPTDDKMSEITWQNTEIPPDDVIINKIQTFLGTIDQVPPTFSAIQIGGKRLYKEARAGRPIIPPSRKTHIYAFELLEESQKAPDLAEHAKRIKVKIHCSSGTYIRSLARDLGVLLNVGSYVESLRRLTIGPFSIEQSLALSEASIESISTHLISSEKAILQRTNYSDPKR